MLGILVYPTPLCCSPPLSSSCATPLPCHCMYVYIALVLWASVWVQVPYLGIVGKVCCLNIIALHTYIGSVECVTVCVTQQLGWLGGWVVVYTHWVGLFVFISQSHQYQLFGLPLMRPFICAYCHVHAMCSLLCRTLCVQKVLSLPHCTPYTMPGILPLSQYYVAVFQLYCHVHLHSNR